MSDDFVYIPVPTARAAEIFAVLAGPTAAEEPTGDVVRRAYGQAPGYLRDVFHYLANRPGEIVTLEELARGIGRSPAAMPGIMGSIGRTLKKGGVKRQYFFQRQWSPRRGMVIYKMSPEVAAAIQEERAKQSG